jgi:hypothetical protein
MSVRERIRKALLASLLGWIAGLVASIPFQIIEAVANADAGGWTLLPDLGLALALWFPLTFAVALYCCGFFLLPIAWLVSPAWIVRHRAVWIAASPLFGLILMAVRLHVWTALYHDGVSLINFWMWAVFGAAFFLGTAVFYARFMRNLSDESRA